MRYIVQECLSVYALVPKSTQSATTINMSVITTTISENLGRSCGMYCQHLNISVYLSIQLSRASQCTLIIARLTEMYGLHLKLLANWPVLVKPALCQHHDICFYSQEELVSIHFGIVAMCCASHTLQQDQVVPSWGLAKLPTKWTPQQLHGWAH